MKLSLNWLSDFVELPEDVGELCSRLTLLGLEVEAIDPIRVDYPGVVVGRVVEAGPHPDADRLRVCRVNVGRDELEIVCGAPNVEAGQFVPVATVGAVLPGDFRIKRTKIRGVNSQGMICSERELGLGDAHEGIMVLDGQFRPGQSFDELYAYVDTCVEIEVTPNRPDWLSHIGVAREIAAYYEVELRFPEVDPPVEVVDEDHGWRVVVEDRVGCPRFTARLVERVEVGASPLWMRQRLRAIGQRPINSIVDVSNYVLHECGHPNHCFDRDKLAGNLIQVRNPRVGETIRTLDGIERELEPHQLLVADQESAIALAGIMGGAESEVDERTTELLLEVAVFDPRTIRRGRRDAGLNTDASYRFERGVDFEAVPWVSRRLGHLIAEVAGGRARPVLVEGRGEAPAAPARFFVRSQQVQRVLGVEIQPDRMAAILGRLQIPARPTERHRRAGVEVTQPSFRHDLLEEIDAIEELARLHGYDQLPEKRRVPMIRPAQPRPEDQLRRRLRSSLAARGFHEVVASSFMRDADPDLLGLSENDGRRASVAVLNPVVQGEASLRTSLLPEMLRVIERNRNRGWNGPIRLFQIGTVFLAQPDEVLPQEGEWLALLWNGPAMQAHFAELMRELDLFDVSGELDAILQSLGIHSRRAGGEQQTYLRGGSGFKVHAAGGEELGYGGEILPALRRHLDLESPVFVVELNFDQLRSAQPQTRRFRPISPYPPVRRDLSLVVPRHMAYERIVEVLERDLGELLESHELFDVYDGKGLPTEHVALGIRLALRSAEGTLKDRKVDRLISELLADLEASYGIRLRS